MQMSNTSILLLALLLVVVLFMVGSCVLDCRKSSEGYHRSELNDDSILQRTEVDYQSAPREDPHYQANPFSKFQPLGQGPIDLDKDHRKLNHQEVLFQEFGNNFRRGVKPFYPMDSKSRFDLRNNGDVGIARMLNHVYVDQINTNDYCLHSCGYPRGNKKWLVDSECLESCTGQQTNADERYMEKMYGSQMHDRLQLPIASDHSDEGPYEFVKSPRNQVA